MHILNFQISIFNLRLYRWSFRGPATEFLPVLSYRPEPRRDSRSAHFRCPWQPEAWPFINMEHLIHQLHLWPWICRKLPFLHDWVRMRLQLWRKLDIFTYGDGGVRVLKIFQTLFSNQTGNGSADIVLLYRAFGILVTSWIGLYLPISTVMATSICSLSSIRLLRWIP